MVTKKVWKEKVSRPDICSSDASTHGMVPPRKAKSPKKSTIEKSFLIEVSNDYKPHGKWEVGESLGLTAREAISKNGHMIGMTLGRNIPSPNVHPKISLAKVVPQALRGIIKTEPPILHFDGILGMPPSLPVTVASPLKAIDLTVTTHQPKIASPYEVAPSTVGQRFYMGYILVSIPSMDAKPEDLSKALFVAKSPYILPIVVTESSCSSSKELFPRTRNCLPSKVEKQRVVREKAANMVQSMGVNFKGTFKVVEEALERGEMDGSMQIVPDECARC
ncbi:hypothetical protein AMTR_s00052p00195700 [Amborella trichopoda]|uniref:Uncharacterized protein n=1 Tax=Amborella trichopoda TaxID=13333 RepID=U5D4V0_AMBTC|nr:hypothetical protein AMTR_s00052p00195700 [Amborella trichopoda]